MNKLLSKNYYYEPLFSEEVWEIFHNKFNDTTKFIF